MKNQPEAEDHESMDAAAADDVEHVDEEESQNSNDDASLPLKKIHYHERGSKTGIPHCHDCKKDFPSVRLSRHMKKHARFNFKGTASSSKASSKGDEDDDGDGSSCNDNFKTAEELARFLHNIATIETERREGTYLEQMSALKGCGKEGKPSYKSMKQILGGSSSSDAGKARLEDDENGGATRVSKQLKSDKTRQKMKLKIVYGDEESTKNQTQHETKQLFQCHVCSRTFKSYHGLGDHRRAHNGEGTSARQAPEAPDHEDDETDAGTEESDED